MKSSLKPTQSKQAKKKALNVNSKKLAHIQTSSNFVKTEEKNSHKHFSALLCRSRYVFIKSFGFEIHKPSRIFPTLFGGQQEKKTDLI